jgi:hypothetical protein
VHSKKQRNIINKQKTYQMKATLKSTNMAPMRVSRYSDALLMSRAKDAGWILTGGFNN